MATSLSGDHSRYLVQYFDENEILRTDCRLTADILFDLKTALLVQFIQISNAKFQLVVHTAHRTTNLPIPVAKKWEMLAKGHIQ